MTRLTYLLVKILVWTAASLPAADAVFYRGVNLNGPALVIDGRQWDGTGAKDFSASGKTFENQSVPLKPATDAQRARMIRSSVWGSSVDVEFKNVPDGVHQVFLYVWEDNHSERFNLGVNDQPVMEGFHSGTAGAWKKLGPWRTTSSGGKIKVSARGPGHGAANLSGIEVWSGEGPIPAAAGSAFATSPTPEQVEFFERKVRPVFVTHCYECHSAGAKRLRGGLVLDSRAGVVRGGDTGPAVTPGDPDASLLIQAVRHADPNLSMPPKKKLSEAEIADLATWVRMGAPDPRTEDTLAAVQARSAINWDTAREWWSFRPLKLPAVPPVQNSEWPASDLDRFILAKLEKAGLRPAEDATKQVLIRRATYDLTGLPPTPADVLAFLADNSQGAFAKVVDRLLASPHYGERWGRHWLDVVRYADTAGDNSDFPVPQNHRYRDWVIAAFNADRPYDQFVREQLAGDLLPAADRKETHDRIIATGYIANARRFGSRVEDYPQHLTIEDTIDNLGRTFLGLTVSCARCHDHKFDPVTTADYYALYGIFNSTRYPWPGIELEQKQRDFVPLTGPGDTAYAVAEGKKSADAAIQLKGDPAKPGEIVRRRFLTILGGTEVPRTETASGRRQLADWITSPDNPLTARVMANRLWLHHFGKGLVSTPNDFGKQGRPPTHPELLDWLAVKFIDSGWSMKAMHRLILLSRTWQLSSARSEESTTRDANNEWLSAYPRRRLDAEAIRDTLLVLGGNLDTSPAGAHPFPPPAEWKFTQHNPFKAVYESRRRSIYLMTQRIQRHPYLAIFDGADPSASTPARTTSTTPLQSLFLLNDKFVHEQADLFAARIVASANDQRGRLTFAWQSALGRPAEAADIDSSLAFLTSVAEKLRASGKSDDEAAAGAWQSMVRVLCRLNEFVYLD